MPLEDAFEMASVETYETEVKILIRTFSKLFNPKTILENIPFSY